ncbi:MAG: phospholipid/cholesterol/gamma-HCH transport system substrate-binding protein [Solirubrobacteraceae bacterium]|jgi:virulence factor Mce-like protein|nr:phospholipid/cholesterol/gamma-HCH transport system substrate-binding protein [Solirubrobacteraceae bacterium]
MQKRAPTLGNMLVIVLFALSCFGLLMFLWESFGGPLPLKPKGYRFTVSFPRTLALSEQSDVRISGVNIGHVVALKLGNDGRTHATVEIAGRYAPIRANMHAILRQKTLLGETYLQLIPEGQSGPFLGDKAQLATSQVEPSVTLDDILSAFDPKTRRDFAVWQQSLAEGINGRGESINASFARLEPFAEHGAKLVKVLDSQEGAVRALVHNTGVVFNALASRDHQLEGLIANGERTFHAAAEGSKGWAEAFQALPTFEHNSRIALKELDLFATDASPYLDKFRATERQLALLLAAAKPFAPEFNSFLTSVGPLTKAARTGLPDVKKTLDLTVPVLENLRPVLHNLDPFLQYTGEYVPEIQAFFANLTAATASNGTNGSAGKGPRQHLLTTENVLSPESLAVYPSRIGTDRSNPYIHSGAMGLLGGSGLQVFNGSNCANSAPSVSGPPNETISESIIEQIIQFKVANKPEGANEVAAPGCSQQGPSTFNGQTSQFPHVTYSGK